MLGIKLKTIEIVLIKIVDTYCKIVGIIIQDKVKTNIEITEGNKAEIYRKTNSIYGEVLQVNQYHS